MLHPECDAELGRLCGLRGVRKRKVVVAGTGRPKSADRCPCGIMTAARAAARKHVCGKLPVKLSAEDSARLFRGETVNLIPAKKGYRIKIGPDGSWRYLKVSGENAE